MWILSGKSIIFCTFLITQIYHSSGNTTASSSHKINENPLEGLRKHTHFSCPSLVRPNNWEIEKFFGNWSGIELYSHKANRNDSFEDTCMRIYIAEVNELNEEMTYGKPIDLYNFRYALRHLKVAFYRNNKKSEEHFMTFNNTNQMLWYGNNMRMQIIKYDGKQMMLTVCVMDRGEMYTILSNRNDESGKEFAIDGTKLNRLILQGRNLKIHSAFDLQTNCTSVDELNEDSNYPIFDQIDSSTIVNLQNEIEKNAGENSSKYNQVNAILMLLCFIIIFNLI